MNTANTFIAQLQEIRELTIGELHLRQPMVVNLLVSLVNSVTDGGRKTSPTLFVKQQDYWETLVRCSEGLGFRCLGTGYFSAAFSHENLPGRVVKIGLKKEDSGAAYAAFCRANAGMKGLPRIHALERHQSCYSVVLDYLHNFHRGQENDDLYDLVKVMINRSVIDELNEKFHRRYKSGLMSPDERALYETSRSIRKFFEGVASFDVHSGNVMVSPRGELVITDPVSFSHDANLCDKPLDGLVEDIQKGRSPAACLVDTLHVSRLGTARHK